MFLTINSEPNDFMLVISIKFHLLIGKKYS
jgi:hypothetical protein